MIRSLLLSSILFGFTFAHPTRLLHHEVLTLQASTPDTSYPREDLKVPQGCKPITLLSAYGEVNENIGHAFFKSMVKMLHGTENIDFQELGYGIDGAASEGLAESSDTSYFGAGRIMARMASQIMEDCPSTLLVMSASGYVTTLSVQDEADLCRRGSRIVHNAAADMDPSLLESVVAGTCVFQPTLNAANSL